MIKNISIIDAGNYYSLHQKECRSDNSFVILFLHGIGESGLCFKEAVSSTDLLELGTLVIPDLPGFGNSRYSETLQKDYLKTSITFLLKILKKLIVETNRIVLISHSAGNVIALNLIPYLQNQLLTYIDLDGVYEEESWRFSSYVNQYKSAQHFYEHAHKTLIDQIRITPAEHLLRYYSSFIRCDYEAFYNYAKATKNFLENQKNYFSLVKEKRLFISSQKIKAEIANWIARTGIATFKFNNLNHWTMIENPAIVYEFLVDWIKNFCKNKI